MIRASDLSKGLAVNHEGEIHIVVDTQHVAKGNKRSYYQTKLKGLKSGRLINVRLRTSDELDDAFLDKKTMQYSYSSGREHHFMDMDTYEDVLVPPDVLDDQGVLYLKSGATCEVMLHDGQSVSITLPNTVDLEITETTPAIKGATATNQNKDATLETGLKVRIPPFINQGEFVRIDTRSGEYVERVK